MGLRGGLARRPSISCAQRPAPAPRFAHRSSVFAACGPSLIRSPAKRCAAAVAGRVIEGRSNEMSWILISTTRCIARSGTTTFTLPWMSAQMGLQLMMALRPQNNVRQHCSTGLLLHSPRTLMLRHSAIVLKFLIALQFQILQRRLTSVHRRTSAASISHLGRPLRCGPLSDEPLVS